MFSSGSISVPGDQHIAEHNACNNVSKPMDPGQQSGYNDNKKDQERAGCQNGLQRFIFNVDIPLVNGGNHHHPGDHRMC